MTPERRPSATDWHPEVEAISEYAEGLLQPQSAAVVEAHLEHCELCADVQASLNEISSLLGELPPAAAMPADIAARIDAAIAAEALTVSRETASGVSRETEPGGTAVSRETESDGAPAAVSRETQSRASAVSRETSLGAPSRPSGHASGSTGPGRPRRRRWGKALIGTAVGAALLGTLVFLSQLVTSSGGNDTGAADKSVAKDAQEDSMSGTELNEETLGGRVRELLSGQERQNAGSPDATSPDADTSDSAEPMASGPTELRENSGGTATVPPCVRKAVDATGNPIAVEREIVRGEQALLLVFPDPDNPSYVTAYVVDLRCTTQSDAQAELLLRDRYRRP